MLASERTGAVTDEFAQHSGGDHFVGGVLSRVLRSLHGAIPRPGRRQEQLHPAGRPRHPRQWPYDDAGKKQSSNRRIDRGLASRHSSLKDLMRNRYVSFVAVCGAAFVTSTTPVLAGDGVKTAGEILRIALPVAAGGYSLYKQDYDGVLQLTVSEAQSA